MYQVSSMVKVSTQLFLFSMSSNGMYPIDCMVTPKNHPMGMLVVDLVGVGHESGGFFC